MLKISLGMEDTYLRAILDLVTEVNALREREGERVPLFLSYFLGEES